MFLFAAVVKLADTLDLGSSAMSVWVQVPPAAPKTASFVFYDKRGFFIEVKK